MPPVRLMPSRASTRRSVLLPVEFKVTLDLEHAALAHRLGIENNVRIRPGDFIAERVVIIHHRAIGARGAAGSGKPHCIRAIRAFTSSCG